MRGKCRTPGEIPVQGKLHEFRCGTGSRNRCILAKLVLQLAQAKEQRTARNMYDVPEIDIFKNIRLSIGNKGLSILARPCS